MISTSTSKVCVSLAICALFCFGTAYGQIQNRAEQRAKDKSNQRIDNKIDRGIDSGLDAIEGLFKKKQKSDDTNDPNGVEGSYSDADNDASNAGYHAAMKMFGGEGKVDVPDQYTFDMSVDMRTTFIDHKGKKSTETDMTMLINKKAMYTGMRTTIEGNNSTVIFDLERAQMISLIKTEGMNMGMVMKFPKDAETDDDDGETAQMPAFRATGQQKTISGYRCTEYQIENVDDADDVEMHIWMTDESNVNWMTAFGDMAGKNPQMPVSSLPPGYPEGAMIEMISTTKKGEKSIVTVTKINENDPSKISTSGYTFMNMGGK